MLNSVLHQPLRTRVVAYLAARGEATFTELKSAAEATDGNLEAHIKKLVAADYVAFRKENTGGRTQTFYHLTRQGTIEFREYVKALQKMLGL